MIQPHRHTRSLLLLLLAMSVSLMYGETFTTSPFSGTEGLPNPFANATIDMPESAHLQQRSYTVPVSALALGNGILADEALNNATQPRFASPRRAMIDDEKPDFDPANPGYNPDQQPLGQPLLPLVICAVGYALVKTKHIQTNSYHLPTKHDKGVSINCL